MNFWYDPNAMVTNWASAKDGHKFSIGCVESAYYNIYVSDMRVFTAPERDVTFQSIPGKHGDILFDNKRMKNVQVVYKCFIPTGFRENFPAFKRALFAHTGYQKIADSTTRGTYRLGVVHHEIEPTLIRQGNGGVFDVRITCKPQVFLDYGNIVSTYTEPTVLLHNYDLGYSQPLITVYGNGPGTLTVGKFTIDIMALTDQITIDCELMTAYRQVGDSAPENKNRDIYAPEFPLLGYGEIPISWDGGITHIDFTPRWWTV